MNATIVAATLAGRCANGYERGAGRVVHAIKCDENDLCFGASAYRAICGKAHGPRSAGWSVRTDLEITCQKCLKKIPTHWMDDSGNVVTTEFLNGPKGSSDWRTAYHIPCREVRGKITMLVGSNVY